MTTNSAENLKTAQALLTIGWESALCGNLPAETYAAVFEVAVEKLDEIRKEEERDE